MKSLVFIWFVLLQTCNFFLRFIMYLNEDLESKIKLKSFGREVQVKISKHLD